MKGPLDETRDLKEPAPARTEGRSRGKNADINIDAGKAGVKKEGLMTSRKGGPTEEISLKEGRGGSKPELLFDQDGVHRNRDKKGRPLRYNAYLSGENNRSDYIEKGVPARVPSQGPANLSQDLQAITLKAKNHTGGSSHRRVGKAETSSGENSFLSSNSHSSADKASGTTLHAKGPETTRRAFQNNGLKQIVEKASFAIKNFQPGITINLKPEFLGHVKIRITTENHLVSVKIMAEIPLVKEMIETNLNQLKADLQDHGLEVDRLDVSLAPDSGKNWAGDEKAGFQKKKEETRGKDRSDQRSLEKGEAMMRLGGEYGETGVVNYFA